MCLHSQLAPQGYNMNDLDNMKQMILLVESAEQLDEINFRKAAATAMAVGALAGAPDVDASNYDNIDTGNQPVATQSVNDISSLVKKYDGGGFTGSVNGLKYLEASPEGKVYKDIQQYLFNGYMEQIGQMSPEEKTGNMEMKAKMLAKQNAWILMAKYLNDTNPDHPFVKKIPPKILKIR